MAILKESTTRELRNKLRERIKLQATGSRWSNPINAIGTTITGVVSDVSQTFVEKTSGLTNGDINKAWRAKILLDRLGGPVTDRVAGLPKDNSDSGKSYNPNNYPIQEPLIRSSSIPTLNGSFDYLDPITYKGRWRRKLQLGRLSGSEKDQPYTKVSVIRSTAESRNIHNKASQHKRNEIIIFNLNSSKGDYQYIILQNRPPEVEFNGETSWASIKSFGRNLPMYHFTGAEDKIQFNVSWFCNDSSRPWEVVQKCRLLEAWSKANGYTSSPPLLQIDWGGSGLFSNAYFILQSATYRLCNFRDGYIDRRNNDSNWVDGKLYPMAATQELIFARVSDNNPTYSYFYDNNKLSGVNGIGYWDKPGNYDGKGNTKDSNTLWQQV